MIKSEKSTDVRNSISDRCQMKLFEFSLYFHQCAPSEIYTHFSRYFTSSDIFFLYLTMNLKAFCFLSTHFSMGSELSRLKASELENSIASID